MASKVTPSQPSTTEVFRQRTVLFWKMLGVVLLVQFARILIRGWSLLCLWNWYVVASLSVVPLNFVKATGLVILLESLVYSFRRSIVPPRANDMSASQGAGTPEDRLNQHVIDTLDVFWPLLLVAFGWMVHFFL